ncbi:sensor histidine kinase [Croceicoccus naphthovorans]|uniref:histidine kinase n=1 Tax=Croceicoccus naphthovorans TaxID=1348774 RepID=A0A0G3XHS9_9SPHN|nr:HAMP domain-containing sensor histidine kinase [Croceicoccus naphthovorans]AKM09958.1 hypothetical protein AB433_08165 [Croceicoccus naphthovorans]MBB3990880.1 signal transduction histidine kinase [Croceicoccus naphthovorans]
MAGAETAIEEAAVEPIVARSDVADRLVSADKPLAAMQVACGGDIPGLIAAPDLLELVRKARSFEMRLGRPLAMRHSGGRLEGWADVVPDAEGCTIRLSDWQETLTEAEQADGVETRLAIENLLAEGVVWLDSGQRVVAMESQTADLETMLGRARSERGQHWTRLFDFAGGETDTPPVWQARGGMTVRVAGSERDWHLLLTPAQSGFQLLLRPLGEIEAANRRDDLLPQNLLSEMLGPALVDPVSRIVQQGEAIRDRLAGPLPDEYREYASDIVSAGTHLRELAEELGDAEAIELGTLEIQAEPVSLRDTAEAAWRLLQRRAEARGVAITLAGDEVTARADRRRLLQIFLNIVGNAIDYGPAQGQVEIHVARDGGRTITTISDEGEPLSSEERIRMFEQFERLGRSGDTGSGLGLYISLMTARAMGGDIEATVAGERGNRFVITLPGA